MTDTAYKKAKNDWMILLCRDEDNTKAFTVLREAQQ